MTAANTHTAAEPPTRATPQQTLLEANDIYKSYRLGKVDIPVLRGVSVAIEPGECLAVLGASGSGKSTLMHILGGLDRPAWGRSLEPRIENTGTIAFKGTPLATMSPAARDAYRRRNIGFVFQFYHLLPELNVIENATIPARIGKNHASWAAHRTEARHNAHQLLQRFGLEHRLKHKPAELSGGERQRVAIARALVNNPDLLLADEPTGNLDQKTGATILDALMQLKADRGQTMVVVTHDPRTAERADRVIRLEDGVVAPN
jgi:ABC-type lipoprotein export system ATPase subunit